MKLIIISKDSMRNNLKANKKFICVLICSFFIVGFIMGIINAKIYELPMIQNNELENKISLSNIEDDGEYYCNAFYLLKLR